MITEILERLGLKDKKTVDRFKVEPDYHEVFMYEYMPTFDKSSDDFMIRFSFVKNVNHLVGKLMLLFDEIGLEADGTTEAIDEVWINSKSDNGRVTITLDLWDMVFVLGQNNKTDLDKIEAELNRSADFERIEMKN